MSSTRQAVHRELRRTGCGKRPVLTPAHQHVFLMGMIAGTGGLASGLPMICERRRKPISGRLRFDALTLFSSASGDSPDAFIADMPAPLRLTALVNSCEPRRGALLQVIARGSVPREVRCTINAARARRVRSLGTSLSVEDRRHPMIRA